jgi:hypothetical protein
VIKHQSSVMTIGGLLVCQRKTEVKSRSDWFGDILWYIPNPGLPFYRWWNKARGKSKMGVSLCPQMPSWMILTRNLEKSSVIWNVISLSSLPNNLSHSKNSPIPSH